jgi:lipopolysaccharide transport system permease protein
MLAGARVIHPSGLVKGNREAFRELVALLTRHRQLTLEMAKREMTDRYMGQAFGMFWIVGHPLILLLVYLFVFVFVFKIRLGGTFQFPLDYTTYLLSGLIPWLGFQESMSKGTTVILAHANLVKQVIFPIEILPVKGVMTSLLTMSILFAGLIAYVLVSHHSLPWTYSLLPLLMGCQTLAMIGLSYVLSSVGVYFRDLKDFVQVFSVIGVYLIPAFYLPESVPQLLRPLIYLNPFSYMIWCYQDVLYFGRLEHWWAWVPFVGMSLGLFIVGYRVFKKLKTMFGNAL